MSAPCPRLGFLLRVVLDPETEPRDVIRLRESFGAWAREQGFAYRIVGTIRRWAYPVWRDGSAAVDADRELVRAWFAAQPEVERVDPGPITDLDES